jgi:hypothetical protein
MTEMAVCRRAGGMPGRLAVRVARLQRQLSDRVHAGGDAFARERGWTIATTTGRLGFGTRVYRDPRFGPRPAAARRGEPPSGPGSRRLR